MKADEVVIVGAGPAGMTTALQLKRYGIQFILLEKMRAGGLLWNANLVENYPGFPAGISGPKLVGLIGMQMERIGVNITFSAVSQIQPAKEGFRVKTTQSVYSPRYVVVASGTSPNGISIDIPEKAKSRVFSDVFPLLNKSNKHIVIIGGGDAAFDYALNLTKYRNSVTILNRGRDVKCLRLLWERATSESAIEYRAQSPVKTISLDDSSPRQDDEEGTRLRIQTETGESIEADYLLFAIGRHPQTDFLSDELINSKSEGLYFVGDVKNGLYRQAAIAAGDGLRAAMDIYFDLNSEA